MSDIPEAIGTATEGGLFARAISRRNGWRAKADGGGDGSAGPGHFTEEDCLNCGTHLIGPHCHECGQQAHLHRTLAAVGHDLLHGVLHLDGKLWRTLPELTLRPGKLTRRYIDGERADFVSPMAMFLFSVFLMFAIFQAIGFTTPTDFGGASMSKIGEDMAELREELVEDREELREELAEAQADAAAEREAEAQTGTDTGTGAETGAEAGAAAGDSENQEIADLRSEIAEIDESISSMDRGREIIMGDPVAGTKTGYTVTGDSNFPLLKKLNEKWRKHPELMLYKLQSNSYKFSWLLIPLSLPFVWILFAWKRRFKAYDHAIFVTYSLAFMSLLFIALSLLGKVGVHIGWLATIGTFLPPIHIYRQLRGAYDLSRFSAAWRTMVLSTFIIVILSLFLQALVVLGAF
ncbi:DUF3667 domain-containing protein [Alteriqipengyuania lutimaris]|uniref:DUF3667 domain-containing protein n=1 Tax=Alteriqipengyuania lutimaris TaxID=1538146 RepID=A0A395LLV0_9SPHN|nr:DUF3667 domain-containing protein [Alteriqipengyuania lutimaris]MBB3034721.1 hypothetical protein [Alteriqipengyuania lutimaris]RDS76424.1 DUF3667 domain-containing protein [Alteriqipengyuania lutimaris]